MIMQISGAIIIVDRDNSLSFLPAKLQPNYQFFTHIFVLILLQMADEKSTTVIREPSQTPSRDIQPKRGFFTRVSRIFKLVTFMQFLFVLVVFIVDRVSRIFYFVRCKQFLFTFPFFLLFPVVGYWGNWQEWKEAAFLSYIVFSCFCWECILSPLADTSLYMTCLPHHNKYYWDSDKQ